MEMKYMPTVTETSHSGTTEVRVNAKLLAERKVFLQGEINTDSANVFLSEIMYLAGVSQDPINVYINSPGGEINAGLIIYDILQSIDIPVNLYCTGMAASMAAIILAGGQKDRRFILPHSKTMIHEPLLSRGVGGSATSIKNISDSIIETRDMVNQILSQHTGKTLEEVEEATSYDHYMNAEESVAFGLCDQIVEKIF